MANEIARGGNGQVWLRVESSLGTSAASWTQARVDGFPNIKPSSIRLVPPGVGGHRNPLSQDKPVAVDVAVPDALNIKSRVHRASTDGASPIMATLFEAAGWTHSQGPTAKTTSTGAPAVGSIPVVSAAGLVDGEACLVELAGTYYPTLASDVTANTITPSIDLPSAQDGSTDVVELMHSFTPVTATGYQVPPAKTLQVRLNTLGYYNNAVADMSFLATGCAVSSLGAIEIGQVGSPIMMDWTLHCGDITIQEDDIAADSFQDSSPFCCVSDIARFAIAPTNAGSAITPLVTKNFQKITFNPGCSTIPIPGQGSTNVGGWQGFQTVPTSPTVTIDCLFNGDAAMSRLFLDELNSDNSSFYIHFIQPVTDPNSPAFGIWMPNCHLLGGSEPTVELTGDMIHIVATLVGDLANWGGSATDIDDLASAPIVIGVSGECAAA